MVVDVEIINPVLRVGHASRTLQNLDVVPNATDWVSAWRIRSVEDLQHSNAVTRKFVSMIREMTVILRMEEQIVGVYVCFRTSRGDTL